ncbi:DUF1722 domain-containing protein [Lactiplantibacillus pentosus]|uniref:YbgA family protein n=1 Tax=Lactiplantibacillus pentosus TaxID=1589 RepID=UPI0031404F59
MSEWQRVWAWQKYWVMARSQQHYNALRTLARGNQWSAQKAARFEQLLLEVEKIPPTTATLTNAYQHVWGYFKRDSTEAEKQRYLDLLATLTPNSDQLGCFKCQIKLEILIAHQ